MQQALQALTDDGTYGKIPSAWDVQRGAVKEDRAPWLGFFRGLAGVKLVTSDAHRRTRRRDRGGPHEANRGATRAET